MEIRPIFLWPSVYEPEGIRQPSRDPYDLDPIREDVILSSMVPNTEECASALDHPEEW